jgi:ACR3 family arsenite efflux pump ArsB
MVLDSVQKKLLWWIFAAVAIGLLNVWIWGGIGFSSAVCFLAALIMIYPSLVPLEFEKLKDMHKNLGLIGISIILNFVVAPSIAFGLGYIFLQDNQVLWVGLMLIALLPGGGMVTTWALKSKADMPTVIGIVVANLFLAIFIVPVVLSLVLEKFFQNQLPKTIATTQESTCAISAATNNVWSCSSGQSDISPLKIAIPIVFIVVIPLLLAFITQKMIIKKRGKDYFSRIKSIFAQISNLGLVIILLILMSLSNNSVIFSHPEMIWISILPLVLFYGIQFLVSTGIYQKFYKNEKGRALVWGSYLRYITLALGLATALIYQNAELSLIVVIIILAYLIQIPTSFLLVRFFKKHK